MTHSYRTPIIPLLPCVLIAIGAFLLATAQPAHAATCSDYPTQAAAQFAGDTIDADNDGIYCESLPCPCSTAPPGTTAPPATPPLSTPPPAPTPDEGETFTYHGTITKVVDGDTLKVKVKGRVKTVRAIGIDTPESKKPGIPVECGAKEATSSAFKWAYKKQIDKDGDGLYDAGKKPRKVTLRTDPTQGKTDKYGRLLAYVTRSGTNFGLNQITRGWAEVYVYDNVPFQKLSAFQAGQDKAKAASRGVWGACGGDFHSAQ